MFFGCLSLRGISFELEGDANDYIGKGLSGGTIIVYKPKQADAAFQHVYLLYRCIDLCNAQYTVYDLLYSRHLDQWLGGLREPGRDHRGQRGALRRHGGQGLLRGRGGGALRGAQLGRRDGLRGRGGPRLRVHDPRPLQVLGRSGGFYIYIDSYL